MKTFSSSQSLATFAGLLAATLFPTSLTAVPIEILNADFETPASAATTQVEQDRSAENWTDIVDDVVFYLPSENDRSGYSSGRALSIPANNNTSSNSAGQELGVTVASQSDETLTISFDGAFRSDVFLGAADLEIAVTDGLEGAVLASETINLASPDALSESVATIPFERQSVTLSYTSASTNNLAIRFTNTTTTDALRFSLTAVVDNVRMESGEATATPLIRFDDAVTFDNNGASEVITLTVSNDATATGPLSISEITIGGVDRDTFSLEALTFPIEVAAGENTSFDVTFNPNDSSGFFGEGPYVGDISIVSNDPFNSPSVIRVTANVQNPIASVSPAAVDFGSLQAVPAEALTQVVTLSNLGATEDLDVTSVVASPSGVFSVSAAPIFVAAGGSTDLTVSFLPTSTGAFNGTLLVTTNDSENPDISIPLTGSVATDLDGPTLVSHWDFEDSANLANDIGSFNNDGTVNGDATQSSVAAIGNGALFLDGDGDFLEIPITGGAYHTLDDDADGFSVAAWVCSQSSIPTNTDSPEQRIFSTYLPNGFEADGFGVGLDPDQNTLLATTFGFLDYRQVGSSSAPQDEWHHVTFVFRGTPVNEVEFFLDGVSTAVATATDAQAGLNDNVEALTYAIGGLGFVRNIGTPEEIADSQWFGGLIDDLRIYNAELSATDAAALTARGTVGPKPSAPSTVVTSVAVVAENTLRIDFTGVPETVHTVASSTDLGVSPFTGAVTILNNGLTTDVNGNGFVELQIAVPGAEFYQIQSQ